MDMKEDVFSRSARQQYKAHRLRGSKFKLLFVFGTFTVFALRWYFHGASDKIHSIDDVQYKTHEAVAEPDFDWSQVFTLCITSRLSS